MIATLVERGFGDRVLLSHDDPVWAGLLTDEDQAQHQKSNPDLIAFVPKVVLPGLEQRGLDAATIRAMTHDNPRRWLTGA
jgi:predicted metal-dependent phosphotriesterase family hydrolase